MSAIVETIQPSLRGKTHEFFFQPEIDQKSNAFILGIKQDPLFKEINQKSSESFKGSSIKSESDKIEPLSPLAQMYFEAIARADILQSQVVTLQAQADLNAQKTGEEVVRADIAEARVVRLSGENDDLKEDLERTQRRLDSAFQNEQRLLNIIDNLRGTFSPNSNNGDSHWAVLGLDPKTAFAGLNSQQQRAVLEGAYRTRSKIFHPDNGGNEEQMKTINEAYSTLKQSIQV